MLQLALTIIIFLIIVIPVGRYMYHIATWNHTLADPVWLVLNCETQILFSF